ncbi:hypothetical protein PQX77_008069 [Marasmius sp. AFHP31]|nr:hypothetical protein PQX77_008069 [Marasmius sp. AFHP31]
MAGGRKFVTLGMFIIDQFEYLDDDGNETGRPSKSEIGGGGTYAAIGARIWFPPEEVGMIVDRGPDFPSSMQKTLASYGNDMWLFRERADSETTKALNSYRGEHRSFRYLTPRMRITPHDLKQTKLERPKSIHFICSPARASAILTERSQYSGSCCAFSAYIISSFDPHPSPNAEEALSLLSIPLPPTKAAIEKAADRFLELGAKEAVVIRSGGLGAYVLTRARPGEWITAFWGAENVKEVIDVTGAGNSFLGGLAAGLDIADGDIYEGECVSSAILYLSIDHQISASLYATVSASFAIQQGGLPVFSEGLWNQDSPSRRLDVLKKLRAGD